MLLHLIFIFYLFEKPRTHTHTLMVKIPWRPNKKLRKANDFIIFRRRRRLVNKMKNMRGDDCVWFVTISCDDLNRLQITSKYGERERESKKARELPCSNNESSCFLADGKICIGRIIIITIIIRVERD